MGKIKKIAIIGHFGGKENILDGQTIKTKILFDELSDETDWEIKKVDTYYKSKRPLKLLWDSIITLLTTRDIIVLLSGNGMKFYFPLLSFFSRFFGTRIYHDLIGGNLDTYLAKYPKFLRYLNSFKVNWVETANLKGKVEKYGITNCEVIPNFKKLNIVPKDKIQIKQEIPLRFCTFSRVMKEKGIEEAISAIESINFEAGNSICSLDIYGMIDKDYINQFEILMSKSTEAVQYKGTVPYDKSVEVIKDYSALLFPTYWDGEGFPGTVVDAFSAGLPVIATEWNCNSELIEDGKTGLIHSVVEENGLKKSIFKYLKYSDEQKYVMRINCLNKAVDYAPGKWIDFIIKRINAEGN